MYMLATEYHNVHPYDNECIELCMFCNYLSTTTVFNFIAQPSGGLTVLCTPVLTLVKWNIIDYRVNICMEFLH